jgi:hypothetical protein
MMKKVDMSERAISKRLRQTDQLRKLSLSLIKAKKEYDLQQVSDTETDKEQKDVDRIFGTVPDA